VDPASQVMLSKCNKMAVMLYVVLISELHAGKTRLTEAQNLTVPHRECVKSHPDRIWWSRAGLGDLLSAAW
jgi:hypothetical protein